MIRTSLIVVSRHRPTHLALCLSALRHQTHDDFEVVLVADPASVAICPELPLKRVSFDQANISAARNIGIEQAAGEVVAFLDDDAIAEPFWLARLTAPFVDRAVLAAAGFTRGPDGFTWQARAEYVTPDGFAYPIDAEVKSALPVPASGAVSTIGTNCAFRRDTLLALRGFDPAFPYYLDETDLNLRMAAAFPDMLTAIVPGAEVVHGIAPSRDRAGPRAPRDLAQIGRSAAALWRRHGVTPAPELLIAAQRRRLLRMMVTGVLNPFAVAPLIGTLRRGLAEGEAMPLPPLAFLADAPPAFRRFPSGAGRGRLIVGWHWQAQSLRARARAAVDTGEAVTVLLLTPSFLPHRSRFTAAGWWEQRGGLWGAAAPGEAYAQAVTLRKRIIHEGARLATNRPTNVVEVPPKISHDMVK